MVYYVGIEPHSSDLYHHGIKGMKWGVRRYRNEDGTLTKAGLARYGSAENLRNNQQLKRANREYNKAFNKAYARTGLLTNITKKQREKTKNAIDTTRDASQKYKQAKEAYKQTKKDRNSIESKQARKEIRAHRLAQGGRMALSGLNALSAVTMAGMATDSRLSKGERIMAGMIGSMNVAASFVQARDYLRNKHAIHSDAYSDELYHFGVKGQKWGIRRYQNSDGTLTEEGKRRYRNNPELAKQDIEEYYLESHNNAIDEINENILAINEKYNDIDFDKDSVALDKYEKEIWDMVGDIFDKHLEKDFGEIADISGLGKEYLERLGQNAFLVV